MSLNNSFWEVISIALTLALTLDFGAGKKSSQRVAILKSGKERKRICGWKNERKLMKMGQTQRQTERERARERNRETEIERLYMGGREWESERCRGILGDKERWRESGWDIEIVGVHGRTKKRKSMRWWWKRSEEGEECYS